jgi:hypothetical protein
MSLTLESIVLLITLLLLVISLLALGKLRREKILLAGQLTETSRSLEQATRELAALRLEQEESSVFKESLGTAQLTTRLQQPRLAAGGSSGGGSPERYRYVQSLADTGMADAEIATVLAISPHEIRQVLALSRLVRQPGSGAPARPDEG